MKENVMYERMKNNPDKLATIKEKKKQYYLKARTRGKIKTISVILIIKFLLKNMRINV